MSESREETRAGSQDNLTKTRMEMGGKCRVHLTVKSSNRILRTCPVAWHQPERKTFAKRIFISRDMHVPRVSVTARDGGSMVQDAHRSADGDIDGQK